MRGETHSGKGSVNRLSGRSLKAYSNSKLWDNIEAKKKAALIDALDVRCFFCDTAAIDTEIGLVCPNSRCKVKGVYNAY